MVTLLKVGAPGKTGGGLQWWSLPQEQRERRVLQFYLVWIFQEPRVELGSSSGMGLKS